jgi:hypothetical protein
MRHDFAECAAVWSLIGLAVCIAIAVTVAAIRAW